MLLELAITNFAIIERLRLQLGEHFTVFTGETGAGKSIIIDAVSALVGDRLGADAVRAGAERAIVEGVFDVSALLLAPNGAAPAGNAARDGHDDGTEAKGQLTLADLLAEQGIEAEDGQLILTREINQAGRSTARVNGRTVTLSTLQQIAADLVDIHGQGAHLSLLRQERHVDYLDRFAGTLELREQVAALVASWRAARRELEALQRDERELARRAELLRFQVDEIAAASLEAGELEALERERRMLANAERLGELCASVHGALLGDDTGGDERSALDLLAAARRALDELLRLEPSLQELSASLDESIFRLEDVASGVRSYQTELAVDPERLAAVEERLDLIARLRRKYGATVEEILAYGAQAAEELERLGSREERVAALQQRDGDLRREIGALATRLSRARVRAAAELARAMERQLDDLHMKRARFQVELRQRPDGDGVPAEPSGDGAGGTYAFDATGIDRVEFLIAPNQGEPFKPLVRIASGGETSRLMLALKTILTRADSVPVLIFDEIDTGISGRAGQVVGEKLWHLARSHQVICVTHLPQIAALADDHLRVTKRVERDRTITAVEPLPEDERVVEIGQMLGGSATRAARENASDLLIRGAEWKTGTLAAAEA